MSDYEIPKKMPRYLKRLSLEYARTGNNDLSEVIANSKFDVREETEFDNWNGGINGHDVIFYVPDDLMGLIPLDTQQEIQNKLREDLNKASSAAEAEFISGVHFEYMDENDPVIAGAATINSEAAIGSAKTRLWRANSIKMFISHRDTSKHKAHELSKQLDRYGISSFVAHDNIEPDEDWQKEIEKALQSMDVLLAFITDDLFESAWTNQEIGYALARDVPVISIKLGLMDPIGFIRNRQAIKGHVDNMRRNAEQIWLTLEKRLAGQPVLRNAVISRFVNSGTFAQAASRFEVVKRLSAPTSEEIDRLVAAFNGNNQISGSYALTAQDQFLNFINAAAKRKFFLNKDTIEIAKRTMEYDKKIPF